jgi:hypothetical protein
MSDAFDVSPPSPPPHKGDVLFRGDLPDGQPNAVLNSPMGRDRYAYSEGYHRGARILVQYVIDHGMDQGFLVYPIIFLYRHHVELVLKDILLRAPSLTGRSLGETARRHLDLHRLDLLWADAKPVLCRYLG